MHTQESKILTLHCLLLHFAQTNGWLVGVVLSHPSCTVIVQLIKSKPWHLPWFSSQLILDFFCNCKLLQICWPQEREDQTDTLWPASYMLLSGLLKTTWASQEDIAKTQLSICRHATTAETKQTLLNSIDRKKAGHLTRRYLTSDNQHM